MVTHRPSYGRSIGLLIAIAVVATCCPGLPGRASAQVSASSSGQLAEQPGPKQKKEPRDSPSASPAAGQRKTGKMPAAKPPVLQRRKIKTGSSAKPLAPKVTSARVASPADLAANKKIEKALVSDITFEFSEVPLSAVAAFMSDSADIPIVIDRRALDDVGLTTETPVTMSLADISLQSALTLMLRDLDLTFRVHNGLLQITTPEEAEIQLKVRRYRVGDLAVDPEPSLLAGQREPSRFDMLMEVIQRVVAPDTWAVTGGAGQMTALDSWNELVIAQTWDVHEQTAALLGALRAACPPARDDKDPDQRRISWRAVTPTEAEALQRIEKALAKPVQLEFDESPLHDVVAHVQEVTGVPILIDTRALDDVGLSTETPVTASLNEVSLRTALGVILNELDLTFQVNHEILLITTPEEAEVELQRVVYRAPRPTAGRGALTGGHFDELVATITSAVAPDSWTNVGGASEIIAVAEWNVLVVSQRQQVQREIESLLQALESSGQASQPVLSAVGGDGNRRAPARASVAFPGEAGKQVRSRKLIPSTGRGKQKSATPARPFGGTTRPLSPYRSPRGAAGGFLTPTQWGSATPASQMTLKIYPLPAEPAGQAEQLKTAIPALIAPTSWGRVPNGAAIEVIGDRLLIRQSPAVHREIERLLRTLAALRRGGMGGGAGGFF